MPPIAITAGERPHRGPKPTRVPQYPVSAGHIHPRRSVRAERDVVIEPVEPEDDIAWHGGEPLTLPVGEPLWLQDRDAPLWWEFLPDSGTLYVQYNAIEGGINQVVEEILARAKQDDVERVVVDLRKNGGGDNGDVPDAPAWPRGSSHRSAGPPRAPHRSADLLGGGQLRDRA